MHITWPPSLDSVKVLVFKGTVAAILIGRRTSSSFHKYVCSVTPLFLNAIGNGLTSPHPHFDTRSLGDEWCRLREAGHTDEVVHGRRLRRLDKGGQGIHVMGLGTKVVPELVLNAWAGVCRCGSLFLDLDSLK